MMKNRGPVGLGLDQFFEFDIFVNRLLKTYYYIYNQQKSIKMGRKKILLTESEQITRKKEYNKKYYEKVKEERKIKDKKCKNC